MCLCDKIRLVYYIRYMRNMLECSESIRKMPTILCPHMEGRCRPGNSSIPENVHDIARETKRRIIHSTITMASSPAGDPIPESQVYNAASYAKEHCDGF